MLVSKQLHSGFLLMWSTVTFSACPIPALPLARSRQSSERVYPKEIRGYKLERVAIEPKQRSYDTNSEVLTFGPASVINIAPLGVTLELPIVISPVKQKGRVDFLTFYDVTINGTNVEIDDYSESFELPTERALTLPRPLRIYVAMPRALIGAVLEWASPRPTWSVTGVVYVFGRFKKSVFKFKRVVPIELDLQIPNTLPSAKWPSIY